MADLDGGHADTVPKPNYFWPGTAPGRGMLGLGLCHQTSERVVILQHCRKGRRRHISSTGEGLASQTRVVPNQRRKDPTARIVWKAPVDPHSKSLRPVTSWLNYLSGNLQRNVNRRDALSPRAK
jgi:hypothetical protein